MQGFLYFVATEHGQRKRNEFGQIRGYPREKSPSKSPPKSRTLQAVPATFPAVVPPCCQSNYSGSFRGLCWIILEHSGSATIPEDFIW